MKKTSLRFKLIVGCVLASIIPLTVVGIFSINKTSNALLENGKAGILQTAQDLADMAQLYLEQEVKFAGSLAVNPLVLDAAGFDLIFVETVGAGQSEVEIASLAHSVLVVEAPGLGDDIQAAKAGILEIADILVLNKADRAGVEATEMALHTMLSLGYAMAEDDEKQWAPPILKTVATEGEGCMRLAGMLEEHAIYLHQSGEWEQRDEKRMQHLVQALFEQQRSRDWQQMLEKAKTREILRQVTRRELSPYRAVERL